jgi:hypothetical protein
MAQKDTRGDDDDMGALQELLAGAFDKNPDMMKAFENMGEDVMQMMQEMAKMSPGELQSQMEQAMKLMTSGDILDNIVEKKDEVLANLEATGLVGKEEIAKYRADPKYFEEQMKGAFDQMKGIFSDPDLMKTATEAMSGFQNAVNNPLLKDLQDLLMRKKTPSDLEIEEMRLKLIQSKDSDDAIMATMFGAGDFSDRIASAKSWKASVMEGREAIAGLGDLGLGGMGAGMAGMGAGMAGMREL